MSQTYKLRGTVAAITEPRTFQSGYTLQTLLVDDGNEKFPQKIAVDFGGDRIQQLSGLSLGQEVEVAFSIRGSEANGRHYVNLRGWGVSTITAAPVQTVAPLAPAPASPPPASASPAKESLDDLPF